MGLVAPHRAAYRVRQFVHAVRSYWAGPNREQWAVIVAVLPAEAQVLYCRMPRPDQHHAARVMSSLRASGFENAPLLQAALLHDVAKHFGGVTLVHRVAVVVIKALRPALWQRWATAEAPPRSKLSRAFWAHAHHPELGARLAASAGCHPLAVTLISLHQDGIIADAGEARLLAALRAADDDN